MHISHEMGYILVGCMDTALLGISVIWFIHIDVINTIIVLCWRLLGLQSKKRVSWMFNLNRFNNQLHTLLNVQVPGGLENGVYVTLVNCASFCGLVLFLLSDIIMVGHSIVKRAKETKKHFFYKNKIAQWEGKSFEEVYNREIVSSYLWTRNNPHIWEHLKWHISISVQHLPPNQMKPCY